MEDLPEIDLSDIFLPNDFEEDCGETSQLSNVTFGQHEYTLDLSLTYYDSENYMEIFDDKHKGYIRSNTKVPSNTKMPSNTKVPSNIKMPRSDGCRTDLVPGLLLPFHNHSQPKQITKSQLVSQPNDGEKEGRTVDVLSEGTVIKAEPNQFAACNLDLKVTLPEYNIDCINQPLLKHSGNWLFSGDQLGNNAWRNKDDIAPCLYEEQTKIDITKTRTSKVYVPRLKQIPVPRWTCPLPALMTSDSNICSFTSHQKDVSDTQQTFSCMPQLCNVSTSSEESCIKQCLETGQTCTWSEQPLSSMMFITTSPSLQTAKTGMEDNNINTTTSLPCNRLVHNSSLYANKVSIKGRLGKTAKLRCRLWEFIRNLLLDPDTNPSFIRWENREEDLFKLVQSKGIAHLWGMKKGNESMNYEKLSRAIRYYYKRKIFEPVIGQRLVYRFGPNATGWRDDK